MAGGLPVSETGTLCITLPNNRLRQLPRQDAPETVLAAWPVVRQSTIRTETTSMTNAVWTNRRALHTSGSQVNSWLGRSAKNRRSTRPRPRGAVAPERGGAGPVNGATRACRAATKAGLPHHRSGDGTEAVQRRPGQRNVALGGRHGGVIIAAGAYSGPSVARALCLHLPECSGRPSQRRQHPR